MVDNFDSHLTCERCERSEDVYGFSNKLISFDKRKYDNIETPFKAINMKSLSKESTEIFSDISNQIIFDSPKYIWNERTYSAIDDINEGFVNESKRFLKIMNLVPNLIDEFSAPIAVSSVCFSKNPFEERISSNNKKYDPLDKKNFETFLQNIYAYSKGMVLVPDIRIKKINGEYTIRLEDYLKTIDYFIQILSARNNKPIFVPIQTNLTKKITRKILGHYQKKGYTNLWVNFGGGSVKGRNLAGLRFILSYLDRNFDSEDYFLYYTHMKQEIKRHIKEDKAPASDILFQFVGGEIIGADREFSGLAFDGPSKEELAAKNNYSSVKEYEREKDLDKNRIFDPETYYYYKATSHPSLTIPNESKIDFIDSTRGKAINEKFKLEEIEAVKDVSRKGRLKRYLNKKPMLNQEKDIKQHIFETEKTLQKSINYFSDINI